MTFDSTEFQVGWIFSKSAVHKPVFYLVKFTQNINLIWNIFSKTTLKFINWIFFSKWKHSLIYKPLSNAHQSFFLRTVKALTSDYYLPALSASSRIDRCCIFWGILRLVRFLEPSEFHCFANIFVFLCSVISLILK